MVTGGVGGAMTFLEARGRQLGKSFKPRKKFQDELTVNIRIGSLLSYTSHGILVESCCETRICTKLALRRCGSFHVGHGHLDDHVSKR